MATKQPTDDLAKITENIAGASQILEESAERLEALAKHLRENVATLDKIAP